MRIMAALLPAILSFAAIAGATDDGKVLVVEF